MVNPALNAALFAAAHQEEMEQKIEGRLKKAGAISPASAIALDLEGKEQQLLEQALASGTVRRTADGRCYVNERAIAERKEGQGFMALLVMLVIASILASVIILMGRAGG